MTLLLNNLSPESVGTYIDINLCTISAGAMILWFALYAAVDQARGETVSL
jgi:hypothetical protein